jgi:hypothetical protein
MMQHAHLQRRTRFRRRVDPQSALPFTRVTHEHTNVSEAPIEGSQDECYDNAVRVCNLFFLIALYNLRIKGPFRGLKRARQRLGEDIDDEPMDAEPQREEEHVEPVGFVKASLAESRTGDPYSGVRMAPGRHRRGEARSGPGEC